MPYTIHSISPTSIPCLALIVLCVALSSCTSDVPRMTRINGTTVVQTNKRVCGLKVWTSEKEVKTAEQQLEDLEVDKERREQELDLQAEERQSAATFWLGSACFLAAVACVVVGYIAQGWKFWGGLAFVSAGLGVACWSFEHLIPHLKWPAYIIGACAIGWTMWKLKDFSILNYIQKKRTSSDSK